MIPPDDVISQSRRWLGVKFLHQGRTRNGADCLGFISAMLDELGSHTFMDNLPAQYARSPQHILMDSLQCLCRNIPLQPGALILFQWPRVAFPSHAAVYTGENLIHTDASIGKVVEHGYRGPWVTRTASIWAMPEVIYQ